MRNYNQKNIRKIYSTPCIEIITLDNEITLVLQTDPPIPVGRRENSGDDYLNNDPYQTEN